MLSEHAAAGLTGNAAACGVEDRKEGRKIGAAGTVRTETGLTAKMMKIIFENEQYENYNRSK